MTGVSSIIILLNTRRVDEPNVPRSWWDLTKPYWKNKLTIDNLEVSGTGYNWLIAIVSDERLGWKFIEELGRNKPVLERGHAGMAQKVAAGEYAAAVEMADFHLKNIRAAAPSVPVRGVWPREGVPREPWTAGILKRAPHPNAAKLDLRQTDGMEFGAFRRTRAGHRGNSGRRRDYQGAIVVGRSTEGPRRLCREMETVVGARRQPAEMMPCAVSFLP